MRASTRIVLGLWAAGLIYGFLRYQAAIPSWGCPFKDLTGIPCPTCGGTRALAALGRLDLQEAILCNPMVTLVWLTLPGLAIVLQARPNALPQLIAKLGLFPVLTTLILTILFNWLLLISMNHI